jgi:hypothetical protein
MCEGRGRKINGKISIVREVARKERNGGRMRGNR